MRFGNRLLLVCTVFFLSAPTKLWASSDVAPPSATSFAYRVSHPVTPLPDSVIEKVADAEITAEAAFEDDMTKDAEAGTPRVLSRPELCSTLASVARANDLPVPFFANLIWHESSFNTIVISRAGAQGIAQFMPRTAAMYDLINPFEPIHAINVSAKFLRELYDQFGNLGLAAAAYNAGPRRVSDWMAGRGALPAETRRYLLRITGRPAEYWLQGRSKTGPESLLMPAKAPCIEVAVEVEAQVHRVRVARLVSALAVAAAQVGTTAVADRKSGDGEAVMAKANPRDGKSAVRLAKAEAKAQRNGKKAKADDVSALRKDKKNKDEAKEHEKDTRQAAKDKTKGKTKVAAKDEPEPKAAGKSGVGSAAKSDEKAKSKSAKSEAGPEPKGKAKAERETKVAAKSDTKPDTKSESAKSPADNGAKTASKTASKDEAAAKVSAHEAAPRRRAVRRQRLVELDRHTGFR